MTESSLATLLSFKESSLLTEDTESLKEDNSTFADCTPVSTETESSTAVKTVEFESTVFTSLAEIALTDNNTVKIINAKIVTRFFKIVLPP